MSKISDSTNALPLQTRALLSSGPRPPPFLAVPHRPQQCGASGGECHRRPPPPHEAEGTRGALTVPGRLGGAGLGLPASAAAPPCGSGGRHAQVGASGSSSRRPGGLGATFCLPLFDLRGQVHGGRPGPRRVDMGLVLVLVPQAAVMARPLRPR